MQVQALTAAQHQQRTPSLFRAFSTVVRQEGVLSLWKGNGVTILHRLPYSAVNFWTYEHVLRSLQLRFPTAAEHKLRHKGLLPSDILARLVAGASAGASACLLVSGCRSGAVASEGWLAGCLSRESIWHRTQQQHIAARLQPARCLCCSAVSDQLLAHHIGSL